ncbi:hypothetical protein KJA13_01365 [Patescibacteria group bacterium]|nr:hypothetical protein [Patescibacteria group bacterium]
MSLENIIKGRIASIIVSLMFQNADYLVINYGHESFPGYLVQLGVSKDSKIAKMLRTTPSFILVDKKNHAVVLLQVKYQNVGASGRNVEWGYEKIQQYWPGAYLLLVRPRKPYFFLVNKTEKGLKPLPILDSKVFMIDEKLVIKFAKLVKKFLS